jgi:multidrug efflux pump subunit AcrB
MLAKLLVLRGKSIKAHDPHEEAKKQGRFMSMYESILKWTLINRFKTLLMVALVFIVTMVTTIPNLSLAFIPSGAASQTMYFQIKLPNETSLDATNEKSKELEKVLMTTKDSKGNQVFKFVEALVGYNGDAKQQTPYASQIYVEVNNNVDVSKVKNQVKDFILSELPKGSKVEPKELGGGGGVPTTDFQYSLKGNDQAQLELAAAKVKEKLQAIPELSEIQDNLSDGKTEVEIAVDRNKATSYGLSAAAVRDTARIWIQKQTLGDLKLDNQTYTTTVSMAEISKDSIEKLGNIPFTSSTGSTIYLKDMAKINEIQSAVSLSRENQKQLVKVTAKINSVDKSGISKKASASLSSITLPDGVSPEVKGVSADITSSFSQLFVVMAIAICIVYLIMVLAFGNASAPFAIMFSLPLAAIGGLIGLVVTREALSITSMIGFMMLIGIVVTNAIVLIDRAQQLRQDGYTVRHALLEAGKIRFRPIIMTAGATIMALVPLALGFSGEGALIGKGLGVVVIGGLFSSTVMTLVVVPIIYELMEDFKSRLSRMFNKENRRKESESKKMDM